MTRKEKIDVKVNKIHKYQDEIKALGSGILKLFTICERSKVFVGLFYDNDYKVWRMQFSSAHTDFDFSGKLKDCVEMGIECLRDEGLISKREYTKLVNNKVENDTQK